VVLEHGRVADAVERHEICAPHAHVLVLLVRQREPAVAADVRALAEEAARVVDPELLEHRLGRGVHLSVKRGLLRGIRIQRSRLPWLVFRLPT
jgi:hypothetical protein